MEGTELQQPVEGRLQLLQQPVQPPLLTSAPAPPLKGAPSECLQWEVQLQEQRAPAAAAEAEAGRWRAEAHKAQRKLAELRSKLPALLEKVGQLEALLTQPLPSARATASAQTHTDPPAGQLLHHLRQQGQLRQAGRGGSGGAEGAGCAGPEALAEEVCSLRRQLETSNKLVKMLQAAIKLDAQKRQAYERQIDHLRAQLAMQQEGQHGHPQQAQLLSLPAPPAAAAATATPNGSAREAARGLLTNCAWLGCEAGASGLPAEAQQQQQQQGQTLPPAGTCQLSPAGAPSEEFRLGGGLQKKRADSPLAVRAPTAQPTHLPTPQPLAVQQGQQQEEEAAQPSSEPAAEADPYLCGTAATAQQAPQEEEAVQPSSQPAADPHLGGTVLMRMPGGEGWCKTTLLAKLPQLGYSAQLPNGLFATVREEEVSSLLWSEGCLTFTDGITYEGDVVAFNRQRGWYGIKYEDSDSEEMDEDELMLHLQQLPAAAQPASSRSARNRRSSRSGSGVVQQPTPAPAAAGAAGSGRGETASIRSTGAGAGQQLQRQRQQARPFPSTSRQQAEAPLRPRLRSASAKPALPAATSSRGQRRRGPAEAGAARAAQAGPNTAPAGSAGSLGERHASPAEAAADASVDISRGQKRVRGEPAEGDRSQPLFATGEGERPAPPAAQDVAAAVDATGVAAGMQGGGSGRNATSPAHPSSAPLPAPPAGQARPGRTGGLLQALMRRGLVESPMPAPSIASTSLEMAQGDLPSAAAAPTAVQPVLAAAAPGEPAAGQVSEQEAKECVPGEVLAAEGASACAPGRAGIAPAAAGPAAAAGAVLGLAAAVVPTPIKSAEEVGQASSAPGQPPKRQRTSSPAQELAVPGAVPGATMGVEEPAEEPRRQDAGAADAVQQAAPHAGPPSTAHATTSSPAGHSAAHGAGAAASGGRRLRAAEHMSQDLAPAEASTASAAAPVQLCSSQGFNQRPASFSAGRVPSVVQPARAPATVQHPLCSSSISVPGSHHSAPASSSYPAQPYPTPLAQPRAPHYATPAHPASAAFAWVAPTGQGWTSGTPPQAGPWTPAVPAPGWGPLPPGRTVPLWDDAQLFAQLGPAHQGAILEFAARHQQAIPPAYCRELAIREFLVMSEAELREFLAYLDGWMMQRTGLVRNPRGFVGSQYKAWQRQQQG